MSTPENKPRRKLDELSELDKEILVDRAILVYTGRASLEHRRLYGTGPIAAIKFVRDQVEMDLSTAKRYVDDVFALRGGPNATDIVRREAVTANDIRSFLVRKFDDADKLLYDKLAQFCTDVTPDWAPLDFTKAANMAKRREQLARQLRDLLNVLDGVLNGDPMWKPQPEKEKENLG